MFFSVQTLAIPCERNTSDSIIALDNDTVVFTGVPRYFPILGWLKPHLQNIARIRFASSPDFYICHVLRGKTVADPVFSAGIGPC